MYKFKHILYVFRSPINPKGLAFESVENNSYTLLTRDLFIFNLQKLLLTLYMKTYQNNLNWKLNRGIPEAKYFATKEIIVGI